MTQEREKILQRVNELIDRRKNELFKQFPNIHEIDDGFILRFFNNWDSCDDNTKIKYIKIPNISKPSETILFFYIPKGAYLEHKKREYVGCITCLSGELELEVDGKTIFLEGYTKMCLKTNEFHGRALENSYFITTNTI